MKKRCCICKERVGVEDFLVVCDLKERIGFYRPADWEMLEQKVGYTYSVVHSRTRCLGKRTSQFVAALRKASE